MLAGPNGRLLNASCLDVAEADCPDKAGGIILYIKLYIYYICMNNKTLRLLIQSSASSAGS